MKSVIDASTALKWVLNESDSDKANRLRDDFRNGIQGLLAPDVFQIEVAHALTKAERRGFVADAEACWLDVMSTAPQLHPLPPLMRRAMKPKLQGASAMQSCGGVQTQVPGFSCGVSDCYYSRVQATPAWAAVNVPGAAAARSR